MTRVLLSGTAALLMSGATAFAGGLAPPIQPIGTVQAYAAPTTCPVVQPVINALQAQGFTRIEVDTGATQARFTALRGDQRNVFVYDCVSGAVLAQEAERVAGGFAPGVIGVGQDDDRDFVVAGNASGGDTGANGGAGGVRAGAGAGGNVGAGAGVGAEGVGQVGGDTDVGAGVGGGDIGGGDLGEVPGSGGDGGNGDEGGGDVGGDVGGGIGIDNGNRGGCDRSDTEGSENAPNDNCGGGNNTGGVDPDNPGAGGGAGRTGGVDSNGNGPGNGGLGGNGNGG